MKSTEEADMGKLRWLVTLTTFTLGLVTPVGVLAADNDPPQAPRVDRPDATQRGEDPLQAPREETR
jgi:hypothetical protein